MGCYSRGTGKLRQGTGTKHRSCNRGRNLECLVSTGTNADADTDNTKQVAEKGRRGILDNNESAIRHQQGDDDADADVDPARPYIYPAIASTAYKANKQRYKIFYLPMMIDR